MRFLIYIFGTGFGSGYTPFAPGTAGSLLALILYYLFFHNSIEWTIVTVIFFLIGVWAGGQIEKDHGKDPGLVVIDEIVGQWTALLFLPFSLTTMIGAFLLFRLFDITKPIPINKIQKIKAGWGIMLDDLVAAVYANIIMQIVFILGIFN